MPNQVNKVTILRSSISISMSLDCWEFLEVGPKCFATPRSFSSTWHEDLLTLCWAAIASQEREGLGNNTLPLLLSNSIGPQDGLFFIY